MATLLLASVALLLRRAALSGLVRANDHPYPMLSHRSDNVHLSTPSPKRTRAYTRGVNARSLPRVYSRREGTRQVQSPAALALLWVQAVNHPRNKHKHNYRDVFLSCSRPRCWIHLPSSRFSDRLAASLLQKNKTPT